MATTTRTVTDLTSTTKDGVGASPRRPDGTLKVTGEFAYSSDMWMEDMLWGATLRSPHPHARIHGIDVTEALRLPGVYAVLTHEDVPGEKRYGLEYQDQPVLAFDKVRYKGEAVAIVAADHPETARRALERIEVDYEVLPPVSDSRRAALDPEYPLVHEKGELPEHPEYNQSGNRVRYQPIRTGAFAESPSSQEAHREALERLRAEADAVVTTEYEVGMQDQAFLGPESGMAIPAEDGGVDLYVATQWLHVDQRQIAPALGLPQEKVRLTLAGVGGAFGAREDLSMQIHACMLALRTGKPVKFVYNREESFYGHVHRHPAKMRYEHGAKADGTLLYATLEIIVDGGAYASATPAVVGVASSLGIGPYEVPNVLVDAYGVYTTNPPCGAMRGFGAVQACFGYESQMDRLAKELGMHPVDLRLKNAMAQGSRIITGQEIDMPLPMAEMLERCRDLPMPVERTELEDPSDQRTLPGGVAGTTRGEGVVRGVGYGLGLKNLCFSEGFDDYSTARVRLEIVAGEPVVLVHTAAAEVGQGLVTIKGQIARTELGVEKVVIAPSDTQVGSAGSSSASRQSYMTGGAVRTACASVRAEVFELARRKGFVPQGREDVELALEGGKVVSAVDGVLVSLAELLGESAENGTVVERTREYHHRPTEMIDPELGQGSSHTQFGMCVHRAVVDVDVELGLVKVVALDAVQDVGKVMHPQQLAGQIQGGSTQGLGLALMEEIQVKDSEIRNPSFTDYLIPTILDTPPMRIDVLEHPDPHSPYGLRGAGEPPTLSSTPAIVAAVRDATGRPLTHAPVRPEDIVGIDL
ncbi:xanthine dehydrogenase family protein molybdopterin-binding subunit [Nocardiopsis alba]|uniref:Xanthine dehydrogenase D subunit n=1 Tax=Nocardiopsis alba (strain ATCC BAA-2165 / BE74) TaxID=1205910 RepID=J7LJB3_NOCAA|nr:MULTISPECIES: molybdopterin cofactor-binding domain-containing protein [Nocardiopsis]AFR10802.1 xanthine dehydrogenase D subunit [Nocardiopsis alba ATCC BAA-2165]MEC3891454.1 molybdopterin cofactor-binding domain-containing protein [Nocardiopsis sp. LDBS1602]